jgi:hypothetical protein
MMKMVEHELELLTSPARYFCLLKIFSYASSVLEILCSAFAPMASSPGMPIMILQTGLVTGKWQSCTGTNYSRLDDLLINKEAGASAKLTDFTEDGLLRESKLLEISGQQRRPLVSVFGRDIPGYRTGFIEHEAIVFLT